MIRDGSNYWLSAILIKFVDFKFIKKNFKAFKEDFELFSYAIKQDPQK